MRGGKSQKRERRKTLKRDEEERKRDEEERREKEGGETLYLCDNYLAIHGCNIHKILVQVTEPFVPNFLLLGSLLTHTQGFLELRIPVFVTADVLCIVVVVVIRVIGIFIGMAEGETNSK